MPTRTPHVCERTVERTTTNAGDSCDDLLACATLATVERDREAHPGGVPQADAITGPPTRRNRSDEP